MAGENKATGSVNGKTGDNERLRKAQATRAVTQSKIDKLGSSERYALKQVRNAASGLVELATHIIDGGEISGELLAAVATINAEVGKCMFQGN